MANFLAQPIAFGFLAFGFVIGFRHSSILAHGSNKGTRGIAANPQEATIRR